MIPTVTGMNTAPIRPVATIRRHLGPLLVVALLALAAAACGGADPADQEQVVAEGATTITVEDNDFGPANLSVPAGTAVTWEWVGQNDHNVVGEGFESDVQSSGTFSHTFDEPGTYQYHCSLHGGMDGIVEVT